MTRSSRPAARTRSLGVLVLLARDRGRGHAAAVARGGVERRARPSRCRSRARGRRGRARACGRSRSSLATWASLERRVGRARRRAHEYIIVAVEEQREELVAEVVVGGDVAPAPRRRVARGSGPSALRRARAAAPAGARSASSALTLRAASRTSAARSGDVPQAVRCRPRRARGCRAAAAVDARASGSSTVAASRRSAGPKRQAPPLALDQLQTPGARCAAGPRGPLRGAPRSIIAPERVARGGTVVRARP